MPLDLDPDGAGLRHDVQLLHPHLGDEDPVVVQALGGDPLGQGLDQVDVAFIQTGRGCLSTISA